MCSILCIFSFFFVVANTYSWELTSCGIDSNGFRLCFDIFSYLQLPSWNYRPFLLWGMLVPLLLFFSLMVLHHQSILSLLPHMRFLIPESGLKVHIRRMVWPFPSKIFYACRVSHFFHTFYRFFLISFWTMSCIASHQRSTSFFSKINVLSFTLSKLCCFLKSLLSLKTLS